MNSSTKGNMNMKLLIVAVIVIAVGGGVIGWKLGQSKTKASRLEL